MAKSVMELDIAIRNAEVTLGNLKHEREEAMKAEEEITVFCVRTDDVDVYVDTTNAFVEVRKPEGLCVRLVDGWRFSAVPKGCKGAVTSQVWFEDRDDALRHACKVVGDRLESAKLEADKLQRQVQNIIAMLESA